MTSVAHIDTSAGAMHGLLARLHWRWAACAATAAVLVAVSAFLPLWQMTMHAPQYPNGLVLTAYGTDMKGDLEEINILNHYVGINEIDPGSVVELRLFPYAMALVVGLVLAAAVAGNSRRVRIAVAAMLWALPIGMLADLQFWLYRYGHDLNADAPVRIDPFTPRVLGSTEIVQFHTQTMVQAGFWLMVAAALLVTVGPWLIRFLSESWKNTGTTAAILVAVIALASLHASPGAAEAQSPGTTIAAAIAAAEPGGTVVIPPGTYHENVVINKPLTLIGEGFPVIDAGGKGDVVRIEADDVTLRGFVIRGSGRGVADEPAGIRALGDRATIAENRLVDVLYGITLQGSGGHTVDDNHISSVTEFGPERRGHAIYLWYSDGNDIERNVIVDAKDGLFLGFTTNTRLADNDVSRVRYGIHYMYADNNTFTGNRFHDSVAGASIMYSRNITLSDNEFAYNMSEASGYGLLFKDVDNVEMTNNRIHHNRVGLTMDGAPSTPGYFVTLRDNLISYNHIALDMFTTTNVTFTGNTFAGNVQQVESRGGDLSKRNTWSLDGRGNYWDDYRGFDADGDGVGDIDYRYEGAFDDLVERSEALRAYSFTFARSALDLSARWFPVYRPSPRVIDPDPLMSPTVTLRTSAGSAVKFQWWAIGAALVAGPAAIFVVARKTFGSEWETC